jgi:glycosyltransferase involved in cell wall biosynthesis
MKKSLLIDCRFLGKSGVGRYLEELLRACDLKDFQVTFLGSSKLINKYLDYSEEVLEFKYQPFSISEQYGFLKIKKKYDIFWTPHFNIPFLKSLSHSNIVTLHDATPLLSSSGFPLKIYFVIALLVIMLRNYKVVFDTKYIQNKFSILNKNKSIVIYLAPKKIFSPLGLALFKTEPQLKKYALCVGNLKAHKNIELVINFWNLGKDCTRELMLIIVGSSDLRTSSSENLMQSANNNSNIQFLGHVEDSKLVELYRNACFFIMPSISEGFGLPVIEAQACETLVLCSNATCLPEVGGAGCIYFNPDSYEELEKSILQACNMQYADQVRRIGLMNAQIYSWSNSAQQLKNFLLS